MSEHHVRALPRRRAGWLVFGIGLVVVAVAVGGVSLWSWLARQTETQNQTYQQSVTRIELDLGSGDVTLTPGDSGQISLERHLTWSSAKPTIKEEWTGQTLKVTPNCSAYIALLSCSVDYVIQVPSDVAVVVRTSSGNVVVREVRGDVRVATTTGNLTASGLRSAEVDVDGGSGDVDLSFANAPRAVQVNSTSGDIGIAVPKDDAYRVQADSGTGQSTIDIQQTPSTSHAIVAHASTGDVHLSYTQS